MQQADQTNPYYGIYLDDYDALEYAYNYEENIQQVIKKAENNVKNIKLDSFEKKRNEQISRYYSDRKLEAFYHMDDEKALLEYDFSQGIILIFCFLGFPISGDMKERAVWTGWRQPAAMDSGRSVGQKPHFWQF